MADLGPSQSPGERAPVAATTAATVPRPRLPERLLNLMVGPLEHSSRPPPASGEGVARALERAIVPALQRAPCVVSFSGGRDSSAVLALAVAAARRHGLEPPVPAVLRFGDAAGTDETDYQALVLRHLGLAERAVVIEVGNRFDALGTLATTSLGRHGLLWPANAYMHVPILEVARGGSLLTGVGGDELFASSSGQLRPRQRALELLPRRVRQELWLRLRSPAGFDWLTPAGARLALGALAAERARWPRRWGPSIRFWTGTRSYAALAGSLGVVAQPYDVRVTHPLVDLSVLAELIETGGFDGRTAAMEQLVGDLLPAAVVSRRSKAHFAAPLWGPRTRAFVASWDGGGIDARWVDVERLRRELARPTPDFRTILLLQEAWLAAYASSSPASS